jgi:hypothetical protein
MTSMAKYALASGEMLVIDIRGGFVSWRNRVIIAGAALACWAPVAALIWAFIQVH